MDIQNIHYANFYFLTAFINFGLAIFVWVQNPKRVINWVFAGLGLCLGIWGLEYAGVSLIETKEEFNPFLAILSFGFPKTFYLALPKIAIPFIYSTFFHFILIITNNYKGIHRWASRAGYIFSVVLAILGLMYINVDLVHFPSSEYYYPQVSAPLYILILFLIVFFIFPAYGTVLMVRKGFLTQKRAEKRKLILLSVGVVVAMIGGIVNVLLVYIFKLPALIIEHLMAVFFPLMVGYAIFKYRLMEIVVRKGSIYLLLSFLIIFFVIGIGRLFLIPPGWGIILVFVSAILITIAFQLLENEKVKRFIDKWVFYRRYELEQIIEAFKSKTLSVNNKQALFVIIENTIKQVVPLDKIVILLLEEGESRYKVNWSIGVDTLVKEEIFGLNEIIVEWLKKEKKVILKERLERWPAFKKWLIGKKRWENFKENLEKMEMELFVPIVYGDELLGILGLKKKIEEPYYTEEELEILLELCNHIGGILNNLQLYELNLQLYELKITASRWDEKIKIIQNIITYLHNARDLNELLHIFLTGVTHSEGLGFNRAMIFLIKEEKLIGEKGIGPINEEEWEETISMGVSMENSIKNYPIETKITKELKKIEIPLKNCPYVLREKCISKKESLHIRNIDENIIAAVKNLLGELSSDDFIIIPLIITGRVKGIMLADKKYSYPNNSITDLDRQALEILSSQISIAIQKLERERMLKVFNNIMIKSYNLVDLLEDISTTLADYFKAVCTIYLYDKKDDILFLEKIKTPSDVIPYDKYYIVKNKCNIGEGDIGETAQQQLVIPKKFYLGFPIMDNGNLWGVIGLNRFQEGNEFTEEDREFLNGIINPITSPILHLQTFEKIQLQLGETNRKLDETRESFIARKLFEWRDLAARVAHKIGNKIYALEELRKSISSKNNLNEIQNKIKDMKEEIESARRIVREITEFAKPLEIRISSVNVNSILNKAVSAIFPSPENEQIEISFNFDEKLDSIEGDSEKLKDAFSELAQNAKYFMNIKRFIREQKMEQKEEEELRRMIKDQFMLDMAPDYFNTLLSKIDLKDGKRELKINTKFIPSNESNSYNLKAEDYIMIEFIDTGIGVAEKDKSRIFEPLVTTRKNGTGLGLSIIELIINHHKGIIKEEGIFGKGARFVIFLPVRQRKGGEINV
ncbi:MAG: GAF domain-containing protein [bacterium]